MTTQTLPVGAIKTGRRLPPETRVPSVSQLVELSVLERAERARLARLQRRLVQAQSAVVEVRLRESERLADAYRVKAWAERRWPEPDSVGARRLRLAAAEVASLGAKPRPVRGNRSRMAGSAGAGL